MTVSVTAVVRGLKVPVVVLDRFLVANGVMETDGYAPFYEGNLDDASKLLRAKVSSSDNETRLFIPYQMNRHRSTFAYIAYAWVFVNAQRKLHIPEELPDKAPEGFEGLRDEIMGFSTKGAEGEPHQDSTGLFVLVTDEQSFHFTEPFFRKVDHGILDRQSSSFILIPNLCSPICAAPTAVQILQTFWRK